MISLQFSQNNVEAPGRGDPWAADCQLDHYQIRPLPRRPLALCTRRMSTTSTTMMGLITNIIALNNNTDFLQPVSFGSIICVSQQACVTICISSISSASACVQNVQQASSDKLYNSALLNIYDATPFNMYNMRGYCGADDM